MDFLETKLLIPLNNISLIPYIETKKKLEHFTEDDYKQINENIKSLRDFNNLVVKKIKEKEDNLKNIEIKKEDLFVVQNRAGFFQGEVK